MEENIIIWMECKQALTLKCKIVWLIFLHWIIKAGELKNNLRKAVHLKYPNKRRCFISKNVFLFYSLTEFFVLAILTPSTNL